ncbi:MAG: hypothetical protein IPP82_09835 [Xanthomonadales bacterium]|nr:hypothetical protein [Xanthomonadales bacterium]
MAAIFTVGGAVNCTHNTIQGAVNAAAVNPGADTLRIANAGTYFAEAVTIGAQDLVIDGGYANCADTTPSGGSAVISGQGGAAASVFSITGAGNRRFENLGITRGDAPTTGRGGGIRFEGSGLLTLRNVTVAINQAGAGGGIYFRGDGNLAELFLDLDTFVILNTATAVAGFGGGIAVVNTARLLMLQDRTQISSNSAIGVDSVGGGLAVFGDATADIGSPGSGVNGAIYDNEAGSGGGIAVVNDASGGPFTSARLFTTDANRPVRVHGNRARRVGGAILVRPFYNEINVYNADACVENGRIDNNTAQEGAAIYVDTDESLSQRNLGGTFKFNAGCSGLALPGSIPCNPGAPCNRIENNTARDIVNNVNTPGAVLLAQINANVILNRVAFNNNTARYVIRSVEAQALTLNKCLVAQNQVASHLIFAEAGSENVAVTNCTITNNTMPTGTAARIVLRNGSGPLVLKYNLLWQPGNLALAYGGNVSTLNPDIEYNITNSVTSLPPSPWNQFALPRFADPARGDFRQRISSPTLDVFPPLANVGNDYDGRAYDQDLRLCPVAGTQVIRDAGAFERQRSDPWLVNGDFNGDLNLWAGNNPGLTSYSTSNAVGSSGGSLAFNRDESIGNTTPRYNAGVQCFNVPAPAVYRLSAHGRAAGNILLSRDRPVIRWRLRNNSENCAQADPIATEGDLFLPNNAAFAAPLAPAEINVTAAQWTANTTIEVRLDVEPDFLDRPIDAGFDKVEISSPCSNDLIFANGFQ